MFEPEIHVMPVGMGPFLTAEAVSLVGIEHESEFFAEVHELID